jgi:hypothetical protein
MLYVFIALQTQCLYLLHSDITICYDMYVCVSSLLCCSVLYQANRIVEEAKAALAPFGEKAVPLQALADFIVARKN